METNEKTNSTFETSASQLSGETTEKLIQQIAPQPSKNPQNWRVPTEIFKALEELTSDQKPKREKTLSLYGGLKGRHATRVQIQSAPVSAGSGLLPDNIEYKIEKEYIRNSRVNDLIAHRSLPQQLMYQYNKPSRRQFGINYRRPLPPIEAGLPKALSAEDAFFEHLKRRPSAVLLFPKHQSHERCGQTNAPCDVLGPAACARCIESTNRHLASEIEAVILPDVDMSSQSLVAPQLAHTLVKDNLRNITFTFAEKKIASKRKDVVPKRVDRMMTHKSDLESLSTKQSAGVIRSSRRFSTKPPLLSLTPRKPFQRIPTLTSEQSGVSAAPSSSIFD